MPCPTSLIDDIPPSEDQLAFHGEGAHERLARAIADLIQSTQQGGKLIGLEGRWGSGKSTVISLMRQRLDSASGTKTFLFDAWAHERDPLRRSFLESLIRYFRRTGWVNDEEWDVELARLAHRRRVTTTRTTPYTTRFGKWLVGSALLVPLGTALVEGAFVRGVTFSLALPVNWHFVIGTCLSLAPAAVILGNFLRIHTRRSSAAADGHGPNSERSTSEWALLTGNATSESIQDTTEAPEPTSIEFEDTFRSLMNSALSGPEEKRFVLVLDNLDRVDPEDALIVWSTLQTFLQDRSVEVKEWFKKIWIIVPYDESGLRRLWTHRGSVASGEDGRASDGVAESFVDKSFQIRFEVPSPVLSNWRMYLFGLVETALPKHQDDSHDVYRVYNHVMAKHGSPPTPRELKLYVNQIVALHRQWEHQFPISHIAYYAALRRKYQTGEEMRRALVQGKAIDSFVASEFSPNIRDNVAGLLFNVEANVGKQLLLTEPIFRALANGNSPALRALEETHEAGFWVVLEQVIESNIKTAEASAVCSAVHCLRDSGLLVERSRTDVSVTIRALGASLGAMKSWAPVTEMTVAGISAACALVAETKFSAKVIGALRETLDDVVSDDAPEFPAAAVLIEQIVDLGTQLRAMGQHDALSGPFNLRSDKDQWLEDCTAIAAKEEWVWPLFRPAVPDDEILGHLCQKVEEEAISEGLLSALKVTHSNGNVDSWSRLVFTVERRLVDYDVDATEGVLLLRILHLLVGYQTPEALEVVPRLADPGHLLHLLYRAQEEDHTECSAWCIAFFLQQQPAADNPGEIGASVDGHSSLQAVLSAADPELVGRVVRIFESRDGLAALFSVVDARGKYDPFIVEALRQVADSPLYARLYTGDEMIDRWPDLREHLPEESRPRRFVELVERLCVEAALAARLRAKGFEREDAGLYLTVLEAGPDADFAGFCRDGLQALRAEEWMSALQDDAETLPLLSMLQKSGVQVSLKQAYQDALVNRAKSLMEDGRKPPQELMSERLFLVSPLSAGPRQVLRNRLRDAAIERDGACADGFFAVFGGEIAKSRLRHGRGVVSKLFSGLVRERAVGGLKWLHGVFEAQPDLLNKVSDKAAVADFRERIQEEISGKQETDEAADVIQDISRTLGIRPLVAEASSAEEPEVADVQ